MQYVIAFSVCVIAIVGTFFGPRCFLLLVCDTQYLFFVLRDDIFLGDLSLTVTYGLEKCFSE